jgi:uncharacterized protein with von Willebrand factor type A (vWA) domain
MFFSFVDELRAAGIPASMKEHLTLLEALDADVIARSPEEFYYLARATFVKDEGLLDRFDQVFGKVFKGIETSYGTDAGRDPRGMAAKVAENYLTPSRWRRSRRSARGRDHGDAQAAARGAAGRHQGGNKWIGTGGTSPSAMAVQSRGHPHRRRSKHRRAIKVWDKRDSKNLEQHGRTRHPQHQVALRRLRRFAGRAPPTSSISTRRSTAPPSRAGSTFRCGPSGTNAVKLLLFLDVGGSMDPLRQHCEELFAAATTEFKNLEFFYFHNCPLRGRVEGQPPPLSPSGRRPGTSSTIWPRL